MTTRTWLGGNEITAYTEKVNFTKCMNSGPQDGTLKCTDLPQFQYNFDRDADGYDACDTIDPWTKETGDDGDGTDIIHEIDVTDAVHSLYFKETSATAASTFDVSYPFPVTIANGKYLRIKIKPVTSLTPASHLFIYLYESATLCIMLKIDLSTGVIYYSTDTGATWMTTTATATLDAIGYIYVKCVGANNAFIGYSATTTYTYSISGDVDENSPAVGITSVRVLSPAAAHGFEGCDTYGAGNNIKVAPFTYWNDWNPICTAHGTHTCYSFVQSSNKGAFAKTVAEQPVSWPLYTFGTAAAAAGTITLVQNISVLPAGAELGYFLTYTAAGTILVFGRFDGVGGVYVYDNLTLRQVACGNLAVSTNYTLGIITVDATHFRISVNGTTYDNGGAAYVNYNGANGWPAKITPAASAAAITSFTWDDIVTSWATAGPDVDAIEAYLYELWSDQTIDYFDMLDERVEVMVNSKHSWAGYLEKVQKVGSTMYTLGCKDLTQRMVDKACITNYKHATYTVNAAGGSVVDDRILTTEDLNATAPDEGVAQSSVGLGGIIKLNPAENAYTDDATSLDASAEPTLDPASVLTINDGTYTDTYTTEATPVYEVLRADTVAVGSNVNTCTAIYVMTRAVAAEIPIEIVTEMKGQFCINGNATHAVYLQYWRGTSAAVGVWGSYNLLASGVIFTTIPINFTTPLSGNAADYCYSEGGNWNVKLRFTIQSNVPNLCLAELYIDKLRVHMTARDEPYDPIEALIYNVDTTNNYLYLDAAPFLDNYVKSGDMILVGPSVSQVMFDSIGDAFDSASISPSKRWLSQDMRGHNKFDVWRSCAAILGGYYYWTLDETSGKSTIKWRPDVAGKEYHHHFRSTASDDIDVFPEWAKSAPAGTSTKLETVANQGWSLSFDANATKTCSAILTLPGTPTSVTECIVDIFLETCAALAEHSITFHVGASQRFVCTFTGTSRKPTFTGTGSSGEINHAFSSTEFFKLKFVFTATTAAVYYQDPGDVTWTAFTLGDAATITANDMTTITIVSSAASAAGAIACSWHDIHVKYGEAETGTALTTQPNPAVTKQAKAIRSVTVFGKDDLKWCDPDDTGSSSPLYGSTAVRDIVIVNDGLLTEGAVKSTAEAYAAKYTTNSRSIQVSPDVPDDNFQIGNFYSVTAASDVVLRRAEYEHDWKTGMQRWVLELDTGETSGQELLKKGISNMKLDAEITKVSNAHA